MQRQYVRPNSGAFIFGRFLHGEIQSFHYTSVWLRISCKGKRFSHADFAKGSSFPHICQIFPIEICTFMDYSVTFCSINSVRRIFTLKQKLIQQYEVHFETWMMGLINQKKKINTKKRTMRNLDTLCSQKLQHSLCSRSGVA